MLKQQKGFSIIEMVTVMAVMIILSIVGLSNLSSRRNVNDLNTATKQVGALLREAQSDAMANSGGTTWGVHFANTTTTAPFYALFKTSYTTANTKGYYRLPYTVSYMTSTLASGATLDVTFTQITGASSASTTIGFYATSQPTKTSSVSISSIGTVTY